MKLLVCGLVLGLSAFVVMAQEDKNALKVESTPLMKHTTPVAHTAALPVLDEASLPEGVITEQHPLKKDYLAKAKLKPAMFRPGPSMPEITNETLLRGMVDSGKAPGKPGRQIGYMPKLKVLPCATGCEGSDYERAVAEFVKGYRGDGKSFEERGEMIVQVRWFNARPFLQRQLPYGADEFGVSFMLEGKVVTLGKNSGVGKTIYARELAHDIGARLAVDLAYSMGAGGRSNILLAAEAQDNNFITGVSNVNTGIKGALGVTDTRSRIEPATSQHANLLPAFDGIGPNEVAPIKQLYYLNSLLY